MHETTWWLAFRGSGICAAVFEYYAFQSNNLKVCTNSIESGKSQAITDPIGLPCSALSQPSSLGLLTAVCLTSTPQLLEFAILA